MGVPHTCQPATDEDNKAVKVKAHKVRKIGTSLLRKGCAVQQVLKAGT